MTLLSALRRALRAADPGCAGCRHFCRDAHRIEAELPGLAALSSSHAAVCGDDGLCLSHDRLINGRRRCAGFQ